MRRTGATRASLPFDMFVPINEIERIEKSKRRQAVTIFWRQVRYGGITASVLNKVCELLTFSRLLQGGLSMQSSFSFNRCRRWEIVRRRRPPWTWSCRGALPSTLRPPAGGSRKSQWQRKRTRSTCAQNTMTFGSATLDLWSMSRLYLQHLSQFWICKSRYFWCKFLDLYCNGNNCNTVATSPMVLVVDLTDLI